MTDDRTPGSSGRHSLPRDKGPAPDSEFGTYVIGRPIMLVVWGVALWGTALGVRLAWIAATQGSSTALWFLSVASVYVPILVALFMWVALGLAIRRFRRKE